MTAEECRSHAKECRDLARMAHAEATRLGLDDIALTWDMLALAQDKKAERLAAADLPSPADLAPLKELT